MKEETVSSASPDCAVSLLQNAAKKASQFLTGPQCPHRHHLSQKRTAREEEELETVWTRRRSKNYDKDKRGPNKRTEAEAYFRFQPCKTTGQSELDC